MIKIIVQNNIQVGANCRIDKYLSCDENLNGKVSRSGLTKLFTDNKITINGIPIKKSQKIKIGQEIVVELAEAKEAIITPNATQIPLTIIYEDQHLAVISKDYGIAVHPGEGEDNDFTLVSALKFHFGENLSDGEDKMRPGIVHRLDKDTSGLMVICKTNEAHVLMKQKFADRSDDVVKVYHTIVVGNFTTNHDVVTNYIMRHPKMRSKMMITNDKTQGKESVTEYDVLKRWKVKNSFYNLLKVTLHSGRTHQIRVTMASLSHPVVGDPLYHKKNAKHNVDKLCLVAKELSFNHPLEIIDNKPKPLSFSIEYPKHVADFITFLDSKNEKCDFDQYGDDDDFDL